MATPVWLEYVEPFATVLAAVVAIYAAADARKSAAAQRQDTELQRGETKRQGAIALETMLVDYHRTVLAWGDDSIDWMSPAHSLTFYSLGKMEENAFYSRRAECLWHLSALIDRGRLFFPNEAADTIGLHKPQAFRGFRPLVLDQLKAVYDCVKELHGSRESARSVRQIQEVIKDCRRKLVSEIQIVVDPQSRQKRLEEILSASSASAALKAATEP